MMNRASRRALIELIHELITESNMSIRHKVWTLVELCSKDEKDSVQSFTCYFEEAGDFNE